MMIRLFVFIFLRCHSYYRRIIEGYVRFTRFFSRFFRMQELERLVFEDSKYYTVSSVVAAGATNNSVSQYLSKLDDCLSLLCRILKHLDTQLSKYVIFSSTCSELKHIKTHGRPLRFSRTFHWLPNRAPTIIIRPTVIICWEQLSKELRASPTGITSNSIFLSPWA